MTEIEFFEKIQRKYVEANYLLEGDGGFSIKRGMAHTVSSYIEDLFALFVAKKIDRKDLEYYVDKITSIRLSKNERAKSFKPDLMIVNNNVLTHYFDVKTNLGWNRNAENYLVEKNIFIQKLKGNRAWITDKVDKTVKNITISENIKYNMIVVFGGNINKEIMENNIKVSKDLEYVSLDILYLNELKESTNGINYDAFNNIYKTLSI